jgi:hypothetical protein
LVCPCNCAWSCSPSVGAPCGPWNSILTTLFHPTQGYIVTPRLVENPRIQISDLIVEVEKVIAPTEVRTVLLVKVEDSQHWDHGKEAIIQQIGHQAEQAGVLWHLWYSNTQGVLDRSDPAELDLWRENELRTGTEAHWGGMTLLTTMQTLL